MLREIKASVGAALCCTVLGAGVAGCDGDSVENRDPFAPAARTADAALISGTEKIDVAGRSVNVSCSGDPEKGGPVIILTHGGGDGRDKLAAVQKTLSRSERREGRRLANRPLKWMCRRVRSDPGGTSVCGGYSPVFSARVTAAVWVWPSRT